MEEDHQSPNTTTTTPLLHHQHGWRHHQHGWRHHLTTSLGFKNTLSSELSGSVGDLGTYIPIVLALTLVSHLDLSTTLIFTALYNIATGLLFSIPMPVQPMKSIASVALSDSLTLPQIAAAGISTATTLLLLGSTGLMSFLYRFIPLPVVRGVQLSQGLQFAFSAIKYIRYDQDFATNKSGGPRSWLGLDGLILAISSLCFLTLSTGSGELGPAEQLATPSGNFRRRRMRILAAIPAALIVFLLGLVICFLRDPSIISTFNLVRPNFIC